MKIDVHLPNVVAAGILVAVFFMGWASAKYILAPVAPIVPYVTPTPAANPSSTPSVRPNGSGPVIDADGRPVKTANHTGCPYDIVHVDPHTGYESCPNPEALKVLTGERSNVQLP